MAEEEFEKLLEEACLLYVKNQKYEEAEEVDFSQRHKKQMKKLLKECRKKTNENTFLI